MRITNAWDKVRYKTNNTGKRTEVILTQIYEKDNLERLNRELIDIEELIICFAKKAEKVVKKIKIDLQSSKILNCCHLSLQALNSVRYLKKDIHGNPIVSRKPGNTTKRLEVLANRIKEQL